ncbi:probable LRR receptor-like serine/threonine-protein kinase At3g47570 [Syzygium oleosum]|uniref:probable LRR receptor-like serine/threonine-protein kinase At3g47570 n=1 Tax=Syzygium oleosum TaxID=219896 RepID=UPI0024BB52D8|nr:probable LRR receptor-like serine/threonine-protein kinase At3g47570 [Syzygium oleosum]
MSEVPVRFGIPLQIERAVTEYPVGNGDKYIRYYTLVWIDVGETHYQTHEYIAWCFRNYSGEYGPLRTFDVPFNGLDEVDPQCADEDLVNPEATPEGSSSSGAGPVVWEKRNKPISSYLDDSMLNMFYGTLLKATHGFSSTNLIEVGSFGSVYKGLLQANGNVIAVTVLNLTRHGALKSFKVECEVSKHIKHQNLIKVLTACSGIDYNGDEFNAIVYEFMVNGSLEEWLHPNPAPNDANGHSKKLSLTQRINISIDVASALDYLHNQCQSPIIHCDLKPSNVLLDADMVGHIGDFVLAKIVLESTFDTKANMSSVGIRGTVGYAASGLSPTSDIFGDNLNLHNYVAEALPQQAIMITNPMLLHQGESRDSSHDSLLERSRIFKKCLETVYHIGLACSVEEPIRRMTIDQVATQLHLIREKLFAASLVG